MNATINAQLEESRKILSGHIAQMKEAMVSLPTEDTTPETAPALHDGSHTGASGSQPGTLGAENVSPAHEELDGYLVTIANSIVAQYECSFEEAMDLVFDVADDAADAGTLSATPEDDASPEYITSWLSEARSVGLAALVNEEAQKGSEEADDDESGGDDHDFDESKKTPPAPVL